MQNTAKDNRPVTVRQAIVRGEQLIEKPVAIMLTVSTILCVLLLFFVPSWWDLLLLPAGVIASQLYCMYITPKWRIWAYEQVADIHQLQRSAELSGLLTLRSYKSTGRFATKNNREQIRMLHKRFSESPAFIDDLSVPRETVVYSKGIGVGKKKPVIILNEEGITIPSDGFFVWAQINNEEIVQVTYNRLSAHTGLRHRSGARYFFRFQCDGQRFEIALTSYLLTFISRSVLDIKLWEFDLLLYIYRGRSSGQKKFVS